MCLLSSIGIICDEAIALGGPVNAVILSLTMLPTNTNYVERSEIQLDSICVMVTSSVHVGHRYSVLFPINDV